MRYGLYLPNFGPFGDARKLAALASMAEQAGWDGIFIWDHIAGDAYSNEMVDPWVALSAIAMETKQIRIGALVTPLPRRRPWKVAREAVSVDRLSGGRLIFGAGSGGKGAEWERFGEIEDPKARGEMLDEGLDILTGLWTGEPFSFHGKHYQVENQQFQPRSIQSPRIPIWLAGKWPFKKPFIRALRYEGVFPIISYEPSYLNPPEEETFQQYKAFSDWIMPLIDNDKRLELICRGVTTGRDVRSRVITQQYIDLGYTWWLEHMVPEYYGGSLRGYWPVDAMERRILDGPPSLK